MEMGLKGRVAIVAGASQGIGRAVAKALAAEGAHVAICARNENGLKDAAAEIAAAGGPETILGALDVTDADAVGRFVKRVADKFERLDICVANAGGPPAKTFAASGAQDFRSAFELNFMSAFHFAHEVIPIMQKAKWGRFITITSTSVRQPIPDLILSSCIRPAVVGMVKSLAIEYGKDGITVNNVAPGSTSTERLNSLLAARAGAAGISLEEIKQRSAAEVPLRRLGKPEEIADAIVWLASDRASYVTGQTILVDGGIYKGM
jgi:3-oxoacyl-[acyl-carrier protein] reductase